MWKWLLKKIMRSAINSDTFDKIETLVIGVSLDTTLSGSEKKEKVLSEAKVIAGDLKTHMLNFAIESAVVLLKEKAN